MTLKPLVVTTAVGMALLYAPGSANAQISDESRRSCEQVFQPRVGQAGKDVIWVPTPDELIVRMLSLANVTARDYVVDLGAGDGKIPIAAFKQHGARALGIEYNPEMAKLAQCLVEAEGVAENVRVIEGDIFEEDFSQATVVTMYLLPELNRRLIPTILDMKPGTRVVSHQFTMGDWRADETEEVESRRAYLWIVPAKVEGAWSFSGGSVFTVTLSQQFQRIYGEAAFGGDQVRLMGALRGDQINFAFTDGKGVARTLTGTVRANRIDGVLKGGGQEIQVSGVRN